MADESVNKFCGVEKFKKVILYSEVMGWFSREDPVQELHKTIRFLEGEIKYARRRAHQIESPLLPSTRGSQNEVLRKNLQGWDIQRNFKKMLKLSSKCAQEGSIQQLDSSVKALHNQIIDVLGPHLIEERL